MSDHQKAPRVDECEKIPINNRESRLSLDCQSHCLVAEQEGISKMISDFEYKGTQPISFPLLLDKTLHSTENQSPTDLCNSLQVTEQESYNLGSKNMATSENKKPLLPAEDISEQAKYNQYENRSQNNRTGNDGTQEIAQVTSNPLNISGYTVSESKDGNDILKDKIVDHLQSKTADKTIDNQSSPVELSAERSKENVNDISLLQAHENHLTTNTDEQNCFTEDLNGSHHENCEINLEIKSVSSDESQLTPINVVPLVSRRQENEYSISQKEPVIYRTSQASHAVEGSSIDGDISQINNHSAITSASLENIIIDPKLSSSETTNDTVASRISNPSITENIASGIETTEDGKYAETLNYSEITMSNSLRSASLSLDQTENPVVPSSLQTNSQQNCKIRNFRSSDASPRYPNTAGNNLPTFKEILALTNANDRIKTFNHSRKVHASIDSGLEEWTQQVKKMYPEYKDVTASFDGPEPRVSGGFGSTRAIFAKVTGSQPFLPSGYHQRQQSGLQPTPTTPSFRHSMMPTMQSTPQVSVSSNRLKSHQVQTKGKELLHTAGVFGGKAGKAGKDFLAKGKNRLRSTGAGDQKTE